MKKLLVLTLLAAAALALAAGAAAAPPKKPTKAQKAEARAVVAATRAFAASLAEVSLPRAAEDGCAGVVTPEERAAMTAEQQVALEDTFLELAFVEIVQAIAPSLESYGAALQRLRLKDRSLRSGVAAIVHQIGVFLSVASAPAVDTCAALTAWKGAAWATEARPSSGADVGSIDAKKFAVAQAAVLQLERRLVKLGAKRADFAAGLAIFSGR